MSTTEEKVPAQIEGQEQFEPGLGERLRPLRHVPLEQIRLRGNPRKGCAEGDLELLAASTRRVGVMQTVLLRECGPEEYELIVGGRRYEVRRREGRSTIPAMVIAAEEEIDEATLIAMAVMENTARVDLKPLEEAEVLAFLISSFGFGLEAAADHLLMSKEVAEERLQLLRLPAKVRERIASKELTLRNAATLAPIAAKAPGVAEALAERVVSGSQSGRALDEDPAAALRRLADEEDPPAGAFAVPFGPHDSVNLEEVAGRIRAAAGAELVPERSKKDVEKALSTTAAKLTKVPTDLRVAEVREADTDRARAFEVLIEYREGAYRRSGVLIDPVFAADWAGEAAERLAGEEAEEAGRRSAAGSKQEEDDPAAARERRRAEQLEAGAANGHLDREIAHRFDFQEEVTLDQARVIAALLIEAYGRDLAGGHRVVREAWLKREVRQGRRGPRTVTEFPSVDEAPGLLEAELRKGGSGPALIGRLFGAIASAVLGDQRVLGSSARPNLELPYAPGREDQLQGLATAALWREAEGCLTEPRAAELRHLFVVEEDRAEPRRDRLARDEDLGGEILELMPDPAGEEDADEGRDGAEEAPDDEAA